MAPAEGKARPGLWVSDGTPGGTYEIFPSPTAERGLLSPIVAGSQLFFLAFEESTGWELWASDGTPAGTRRVKDILPGPASSRARDFSVVDGSLVFAAIGDSGGHELWASDGTGEGTRKLAEIEPGPVSSGPRGFTALGEEVLFSAYDREAGRELRAFQRSELSRACRRTERRLCLQDGRFGVEVEWQNQRDGSFGTGTPVPFSEDTGTFWFFDENNIELIVKALDGRTNNDNFWVFSGALSDVKYWVTIEDFETGPNEDLQQSGGQYLRPGRHPGL